MAGPDPDLNAVFPAKWKGSSRKALGDPSSEHRLRWYPPAASPRVGVLRRVDTGVSSAADPESDRPFEGGPHQGLPISPRDPL